MCDEPTSALDVSIQAQIINLLLRLQAEHGLAYLFISHDLDVVRNIAQSAIVLSQGTVVEAGPVEQILENPTNPYTVRLIQDVPRLAAAGAGQIRSAVRLDPPGAAGPAAPATQPASPWSAP